MILLEVRLQPTESFTLSNMSGGGNSFGYDNDEEKLWYNHFQLRSYSLVAMIFCSISIKYGYEGGYNDEIIHP